MPTYGWERKDLSKSVFDGRLLGEHISKGETNLIEITYRGEHISEGYKFPATPGQLYILLFTTIIYIYFISSLPCCEVLHLLKLIVRTAFANANRDRKCYTRTLAECRNTNNAKTRWIYISSNGWNPWNKSGDSRCLVLCWSARVPYQTKKKGAQHL